MELSEALKANASVLEGLLPLATNETKGLASMNIVDENLDDAEDIEIL